MNDWVLHHGWCTPLCTLTHWQVCVILDGTKLYFCLGRQCCILRRWCWCSVDGPTECLLVRFHPEFHWKLLPRFSNWVVYLAVRLLAERDVLVILPRWHFHTTLIEATATDTIHCGHWLTWCGVSWVSLCSNCFLTHWERTFCCCLG